ncbi:hypothetical protein [Aldersonia kunmingensis]|uniref:hypothetical protein n=1 Tax=Aldersonia kunmingensis TaxID=408066 RepID=UPI00083655CD|nr:hypothetical protein [Aldersonia kunmingensis]
MQRIGSWWDAIELWVAGLPFLPQFVVLVLVLVPVSFVLAFGLDTVVNAVLRLIGRRGDDAPVRVEGQR